MSPLLCLVTYHHSQKVGQKGNVGERVRDTHKHPPPKQHKPTPPPTPQLLLTPTPKNLTQIHTWTAIITPTPTPVLTCMINTPPTIIYHHHQHLFSRFLFSQPTAQQHPYDSQHICTTCNKYQRRLL